jgi:hypothetical protein
LHLLREAVETLAMSAEQQADVLREGPWPVDELAETFSDIWLAVPVMRREGVPLSEDAVMALDRIVKLLEGMSGPRHADVWVESALATDARWSEVREAATDALRLLPEP